MAPNHRRNSQIEGDYRGRPAETSVDDGLIQIREVWHDNLDQEIARIRDIVDDYPYVAMDTEFPGIVLKAVGKFKNLPDEQYQNLKINVDALKLIQLGLTFSDASGNLPTNDAGLHCVWQFNFRDFDPDTDIFAEDSIKLLLECGHDFKKNVELGINSRRFGELFMSSGAVMNESVRWITFHGGYDFGYLIKLLSGTKLPAKRSGFVELLNAFFPVVYDVKHLIKFCNDLGGGLKRVAEQLGIKRTGVAHQAGSDSLLTSRVFTRLNHRHVSFAPEMHSGVLYGIDFHFPEDISQT